MLLSYAGGDVLECGVGTGMSLRYYDANQVKSYTGVDWSSSMLEKAFEEIDELKRSKIETPPNLKLR